MSFNIDDFGLEPTKLQGRLAHFKIPRFVFFVDDFPMTVTGKVQKYILREQLAKELEKAS